MFTAELSSLMDRIRQALPPGVPVYLVGGAVRDLLLSRPVHDLDFVLAGNVLEIGRRTANALGAAYYPLDTEHDTARVILIHENGSREVMDFAALRGPDLESDLRARDFTINAMALALDAMDRLVDPLGGAADLRRGVVQACSPTSLESDPLRILRGVRLASAFGFRISAETRSLMRAAVPGLARVSPERIRDEIFRMLGGSQPATSIRVLAILGALEPVLPELLDLQGVEQSPPHQLNVWDHTLTVLQRLEAIFAVLAQEYDLKAAESMSLAELSLRLGRYRDQIHAHLGAAFTPDRTRRELLLLAALYHDIGKPRTRTVEEGGRIRFIEHEQVGTKMAAERSRLLRLSNAEIEHLSLIIRHHMRPLLLAQQEEMPSPRAVYRFFRDTGPAGVDICLLSLADVLGTHGPALQHEAWEKHVSVVRVLLEGWWERSEQQVKPPLLINGHDLMKALDLPPGPKVGTLLEAVREAQVTGQVENREQALEFARLALSGLIDS